MEVYSTPLFMYYVYILQSELNSELYTGSSNDLKKRFQEHNDGKVTSTKRYKPWKLIYYEAYQTEKLARIREKRLKYNGNAMRELKKRIGLIKGSTSLPRTTFKVSKSGAGFTFIELILYISIVTIMLSAIIPFAWSIIGSGAKSATEQEVFSQARYVSERIKYEIRQASGITNVSATSVSLTNFSPDTTTVIDLFSEKARINKNGTGAVNLNSDDTKVTDLTFTDYTSTDNKTKHIGFILTIEQAGSSQRQEFKETVTFRSSAEVRSN